MQNRSTTALIAVNNQAAGGNRILSDVKGPNLVSRIDRDVLAQTGVQKYAIMFEGVNDLGKANATEEVQNAVSDALILAMKQVALRLHAAQIPVFAATIIPFGASDIRSPFREAARQKVNAFIRGSDIFEGVVDFDAVVADPESPTNIKAEYDFGDGEHLNPTGNAAVADSFPLEMFERFAGGVRRYM
ncbi:GDSL-like Lipase/Acylhydrolase family protein [Mycena kentingensis (nom. inval.)]|nr:GDSL-like Lipase/Acylhydrolase family protein [Mycena kentingensis (nom. inval.)]